MANTLTSLIPTMYAGLDVVSRELTGYIAAVSRNSSLERAAIDQSILVPIAPAATTGENTPGVTAPDTGDQTIGNVEITISKSKHVPIRWNGEQTKGMMNAGTYNTVLQDQFAQAFRTLTNLIEVDLATTFKQGSRAYGTPTVAPFGTAADLSDGANVRRILDDNGAPQSDLHLVLGSAAMANIRGKQSVLFKVNESGTEDLLRRGVIGELQGFHLHNSAAVAAVTKGTGASYITNTPAAATLAIGSTTIGIDTGSGTVLTGDTVTFVGDTNKYVVKTGVAAAGDIVIAEPGLRQTLADGVAMTVGATATQNLAFHRSAIQLVTRAPALPTGGDSADDVQQVIDPVSGLGFEVALYRQFLQNVIHVRLAWGWKAIAPRHIAPLLG